MSGTRLSSSDPPRRRRRSPGRRPGNACSRRSCTVIRRVMGLVGRVLLRQRLVGDGDGRLLGVVALVETAAGPEGHRHRVEAARGGGGDDGGRLVAGRGRRAVVQRDGGVRCLVGEAEGELRHGAGAGDAGKGANAGEGLGVVRWGWPWRRLRSSGTPAAPRCSAGMDPRIRRRQRPTPGLPRVCGDGTAVMLQVHDRPRTRPRRRASMASTKIPRRCDPGRGRKALSRRRRGRSVSHSPGAPPRRPSCPWPNRWSSPARTMRRTASSPRATTCSGSRSARTSRSASTTTPHTTCRRTPPPTSC